MKATSLPGPAPGALPRRTSPEPPGGWRYDLVAQALHWLLALLLALMVGVGWTMMAYEDDPASARWFELHKSVGLLVATLVLVRLGWRLAHRPPTLPAAVPRWQARLAGAVQGLLYLLMLAMPLSGYLGASYSKHGAALFGFALPAWATPDHDRAEQFFGIHAALAWVLVALVLLHVAGAVKHRWVDRDGIFQRMTRRASRTRA